MIWTSIAKEPQRFPIFQGGGQDPLSGSAQTENLLTGMFRIKSNKIKTIIMNPVQFAYVL